MEASTISTPADAGIAAARHEAQAAREAAEAFKQQMRQSDGSEMEVLVGGKHYTVRVRGDEGLRRHGGKARAFVTALREDQASPNEVLSAFARMVGAPSVYTKRGAFPALDKAWDAFNAHIVAEKARVLRAAMAQLVDDVEELMDGAKFSRTAGCSCGCSPGFVVDGLPPGLNVWVDEVQS